jgi:phospholipase/carboxylesterase
MPTTMLGPLRVRRFSKTAEPNDKPSFQIVLLHGFGAPGDDLAGLAGAIEIPTNGELIFPEAPLSLAELTGQRGYGDARAWWMIDMVRMQLAAATGTLRDLSQDVPDGLSEANEALNAMLDALAKENPEAKVVLGGFSQGSMLSLDVALRSPARKLAGLVLLSSTILAEPEWAPLMAGRKGLPVFQSHGRSDAILPYGAAERLSKSLSAAGLEVEFDSFDSGHTIPMPTLRRLSAWLQKLG